MKQLLTGEQEVQLIEHLQIHANEVNCTGECFLYFSFLFCFNEKSSGVFPGIFQLYKYILELLDHTSKQPCCKCNEVRDRHHSVEKTFLETFDS